MLISRNLKLKLILFYTWKSLLYYTLLAIAVFLLHDYYKIIDLSIPFNTITALSTALAIFLGFKNNYAYDRWWEARKVWGLLVNYSRVWEREVRILIGKNDLEDQTEINSLKRKLVFRHIGFVNALRVYLRKTNGFINKKVELFEEENQYVEVKNYLDPVEFVHFYNKNNPPNYLLNEQGKDLKNAYDKNWIKEYHLIRLEETLIEFNNIQGMCERIKNTPFLRQYSFFSRVFVFIHASLIPFAFVSGDLHLAMIPISVAISFVFLALDLIGERTEDPFENRLEDVSMTALCTAIERDLKESIEEPSLPEKIKSNADGVLM
ncbi:bestrophin family protein [Pedobacter alpinus]|uniref:Bestrophin family protein n=1 Tax=Pedobacter alpinus TaxID=1590643 RepID=A0ABW5TXF2_9SPHI